MITITHAATAAAICAAVLLTGTACTSSDDGPKTSAEKSAPVSPTPTASDEPAADAVQHVDGESVTEAPKIDRKTIASFANAWSGRTIPFEGGLRKGRLGIALNCEGKGTVKVEVPALGMTSVEECADGKVATIYSETEVSAAAPDAYVQVTGTSGVRWSVSAGQ
ncbi:hypothetical protein RB628_34255 [Streptomyces sp. ADMS]|uniref:hypothetical protein n=1 Tax=Streptomyces sp. ADMS TaxID=3071415 RepID=UPI00296FAD86|nr:hypothetical protein [Streptomyces sp. ADMS]MDW4910258.1 hypothetical protein [Streptomyces sp. ADMS]